MYTCGVVSRRPPPASSADRVWAVCDSDDAGDVGRVARELGNEAGGWVLVGTHDVGAGNQHMLPIGGKAAGLLRKLATPSQHCALTGARHIVAKLWALFLMKSQLVCRTGQELC